jgi:hypothetical protein
MLDVAVVLEGSNRVNVLIGRGSGSFYSVGFCDTGNEPNSVAIGDLNGDQIPDLAVANGGSYDIAMLAGIGDGHFLAPRFYGTGRRPQSVAIGDLDNDQVSDIVLANRYSGDVAVLLGCVSGPTSVETMLGRQRLGLALVRNQPNPFANSTMIILDVPARGQITVGIYDVCGRLVRRLLAQPSVAPGEYRISWDGKAQDGRTVNSGIYVCQLRLRGYEVATKFHFMR